MSGGDPAGGFRRIVIASGEAGQRLDRILAARLPGLSRAYLQKLIRDGRVLRAGAPGVAGAPVKASHPVATGDVIEVTLPEPEPSALAPEAIALDVLYEDASLIVVNKPSGLVVHPGAGARTGTLVHALLHHCRDLSGIGGVERPGIVHRLDKETSGVLVVAKSDTVHRALSRQFADRTVSKVYHALVLGRVARTEGVVEAAIGRDTKHRLRFSTRTATPRDAVTRYRVMERFDQATLLEVHPRTGRTHQIRVHMKLIGHPIAGDTLYGGSPKRGAGRGEAETLATAIDAFGRLALHASRLEFTHPDTGGSVAFEAPLPGPFANLLAALRG